MFSRRAYVAAAIAAQPLRVGEYSQIADSGRLAVMTFLLISALRTASYLHLNAGPARAWFAISNIPVPFVSNR
jgi:hypothetical protein